MRRDVDLFQKERRLPGETVAQERGESERRETDDTRQGKHRNRVAPKTATLLGLPAGCIGGREVLHNVFGEIIVKAFGRKDAHVRRSGPSNTVPRFWEESIINA